LKKWETGTEQSWQRRLKGVRQPREGGQSYRGEGRNKNVRASQPPQLKRNKNSTLRAWDKYQRRKGGDTRVDRNWSEGGGGYNLAMQRQRFPVDYCKFPRHRGPPVKKTRGKGNREEGGKGWCAAGGVPRGDISGKLRSMGLNLPTCFCVAGRGEGPRKERRNYKGSPASKTRLREGKSGLTKKNGGGKG